jgi:hypothetical protein
MRPFKSGLLVAPLLLATALADTYYVDGGWQGPSQGTADAPFRTLGEAVAAFVQGEGHEVRVAAGVYLSRKAGGQEDFGTDGYDLKGRKGVWRGGYAGFRQEAFDWERRTFPGAGDDVKLRTVVDLSGAGSRAFVSSGDHATTIFEGFVFRDAEVGQEKYAGGALSLSSQWTGPEVRRCAFLGNRNSKGRGGALFIRGAEALVSQCTFAGNQSADGGAVAFEASRKPGSCTDSTFRSNRAANMGGGLLLEGGSVTVAGCDFRENSAGEWGGGIGTGRHQPVNVDRSRFLSNRAKYGAAVGGHAYGGPVFTVRNTLLAGNASQEGEGAAVQSHGGCCAADIKAEFITAVDNDTPGGILRNSRSNPQQNAPLSLINSILVGEGPVAVHTDSPDAVVSHCLVYGFDAVASAVVTPGDGILAAAPLLRDPANGDYRPFTHSPAVNAAAGDSPASHDLVGNSRPYSRHDPGVDMGCYEVAPVPADAVLLLQ